MEVTFLKSYMEILTMIDTLKNKVFALACKNNDDELMKLYEQIHYFFMERMGIFEEIFLKDRK